jgi:Tol biopolymer transport system component
MSDERWLQVKALFQAALERPPSERAAFLSAATGGDAALRREVESLLDSDDSGGFTNRLPGRDVSPHGHAGSDTTFAANEQLGQYRIVGLLGAGGMGEVFRARDSKLNRDVALKVLPAIYELDPDRLARFRREAQALAALNHPHIAAIYGIEESKHRQALVLELVEGRTLANRIAEGPVPLAEALPIARQIADALQAAHAKGITHRDLKPANIKVTPAGVVKVLDFGLAKTAAEAQPTRTSATFATPDETLLGAVVGTAAYMSPEQARGLPVDTRTDIWAFGCVLFEMLAGRRAFPGESVPEAIEKVLSAEPDWSRLPKNTPAKVQQLLRRCLQKNREQRLQTVAEARAVLDQLLGAPAGVSRTRVAMAAAVVLSIAAGYVWLQDNGARLANRSDWVQLTNLDSAAQPALSPDGRMLAFVRGPGTFMTPGQIYIKLLPDGVPVALTNDRHPKMSPVFSPDGNRIVYSVNDGGSWDTWEVQTLRGEARPWLRNASGLTWVGQKALLFSEIKTGNHMVIATSSDGRSASRDLYVPPHTSGMAHRSYASPDAKWALLVEMDQQGVWLPCRRVPIAGGDSQPAGPPKSRCTDAAWSTDGRWMFFSADAGDGFHVWRQRFPDGAPEQVTSGPTSEQGLAIAPDGKSLITAVGLAQRSVWFHDASGDRQLSLEGYAFWPLVAADGKRVLFRLSRDVASGQSPSELWMVDAGSGESRRLFPNQLVTAYDLSADDLVVAAIAERDGGSGIWLAPLDGSEAAERIPGADGDNPRFVRDGEILFRVTEGNAGALHRIRKDGGGRERVTTVSSHVLGGISPDGEWVSSYGLDVGQMLLYSTSGKPPLPVFASSQSSRVRWSRDGTRAYLSIQNGQASAFALGRTYVLPIPRGSRLPVLPAGGFRSEAEMAAVPGVQILEHGDVAFGASPAVYAYSRVTTTQNLYRIPIK